MNVEKLIEYVTAEVLKRINHPRKKKVLIIGQEDEMLLQCQKVLAIDYEVEISSLYNDSGDYDYIVLSDMDTDLLANAALGLLSEKYPIIHQALMEGTPIEIIEEGMAHRKHAYTCNANFYALFLEYEKKIQSFGMAIKPINELNVIKKPEPVMNEVVKKDKLIREDQITTVNKKLITEQILRNELTRGITKVQVSQGTLVTPLASDYAREHKMTIVRM